MCDKAHEFCGQQLIALLSWKTVRQSTESCTELLYGPAIPVLGRYPREMETYVSTDTCTQIFITALSTTATWRKQSKCLSMDEWTNTLRSLCTMEDYSAIKGAEYSCPMWLGWLERGPVNQRVTGFVFGQGTCLGCGFGPGRGAYKSWLRNVSLSHRCFSLSLFLPSSLSKIYKHVLG